MGVVSLPPWRWVLFILLACIDSLGMLCIGSTSSSSYENASSSLIRHGASSEPAPSPEVVSTPPCKNHVSRPVFLFHGVGDNAKDFERPTFFAPSFVELLIKHGVYADDIFDIPLYEDPYSLLWPLDYATIREVVTQCVEHRPLNKSLTPLLIQIVGIAEYITATIVKQPEKFANGYDLICHSQGGVLCTGVVAHMSKPPGGGFHSLISIAGPQLGVYYPLLPGDVEGVAADILYTKHAQECASVANFWHDPDPKKGFMTKSAYFPQLLGTNQNASVASSGLFRNARKNMAKLKAYVLAASPQDGLVMPWESGIWGFYKDPGPDGRVHEVQPLEESPFFKMDLLSLKTLARSGRLHKEVLPGVGHMQWMHDGDAFKQAILPYLAPSSVSGTLLGAAEQA